VYSSDILNASTSKKEDVEKRALELRYELAIQRAAGIQLERALRDATTAVSRLLDVRRTSHSSAVVWWPTELSVQQEGYPTFTNWLQLFPWILFCDLVSISPSSSKPSSHAVLLAKAHLQPDCRSNAGFFPVALRLPAVNA